MPEQRERTSLRETLEADVDVLIRPVGMSLVPGRAERTVRRAAGAGSGRIGKDVATDPRRLRAITRSAAERAAMPLLVSVNQEGGRLNALDWPGMTQLPGQLALGAAGDAELAREAGRAVGAQLRAVGLRWNLAPVADTARWPSAPAIGTRAFGSDPDLVAHLVAAYVEGLQEHRVAATAKHFPGLGATAADPHTEMPVVERLPEGALRPFRAAVAAGVAAVMVGSHTVRELDDLPGFASARVISLLRNELGFSGVVVSENLSLPVVHRHWGGIAAAAVSALAAGVDVVMLDSEISRGRQPLASRQDAARRRRSVAAAILEAVHRGELDRDTVTASAARVRALHGNFGLTSSEQLPSWDAADMTARHTADRIAQRSVTLARGAGSLPLPPCLDEPLVVVRVPDTGAERRADSARHASDALPRALARRYPHVAFLPADAPVPGAGPVIVYGYDTRTPAAEPSRASQAANRIGTGGRTVIQVALGDPDDLVGSRAAVLIAAYSPHEPSIEAVARILTGELHPAGQLPAGEI